MRIGILTQPLKCNYGGIIQNFALQSVLKRMGHDVWTIDIDNLTWSHWLKVNFKILILKFLGRELTFLTNPYKKNKKERPLRKFVKYNISITKPRTYTYDRCIVDKYKMDCIIVGSDQVWRPM